MNQWDNIKQEENLDGLLLMDYRGYNYYNKNFPSENYQIHCLSNLSQFFFPENAQSTVIGVEGTDTTTVIQTNTDGSVVAIRKLKSQEENK